MPTEPLSLAALIKSHGLIFGVLTFIGGALSTAFWFGSKTKGVYVRIDTLESSVGELKESLEKHADKMDGRLDRIHERIDSHMEAK